MIKFWDVVIAHPEKDTFISASNKEEAIEIAKSIQERFPVEIHYKEIIPKGCCGRMKLTRIYDRKGNLTEEREYD